MATEVRNWVQTCITCAKGKLFGTTKAPMTPMTLARYVWQRIALDILGPLPITNKGYIYVLMMSEYVSKFIIAVPLPDQTSNRVANAFIHNVILKYGTPNEILTDQETSFQSETMKELNII